MERAGGGDEGPEARRRRLVETLQARPAEALPGAELARRLGVSRQVVVQDIAVLRARGLPVLPSARGYRWAPEDERPDARLRARVAVRHRPEETAAELYALVACGVRVLDVVVEHPLYGELTGRLDLATPAQVGAWLEALAHHEAGLLSVLTGGVHLHTLEAADPMRLAAARARLRELGFLLL
jgi:transcriptional regulator of NAD metabolism